MAERASRAWNSPVGVTVIVSLMCTLLISLIIVLVVQIDASRNDQQDQRTGQLEQRLSNLAAGENAQAGQIRTISERLAYLEGAMGKPTAVPSPKATPSATP